MCRNALVGCLLCTGALVAASCGEDPDRESSWLASAAASPTDPFVHSLEEAFFVESAAALGIDFVHINGKSGQHYFHEMMGAGVALFDYDQDGDLDLYLVQGHELPVASESPPFDRLFRNQLIEGGGAPSALYFEDVTEQSGLRATSYGMGVAVGDFDNNGYPDLYLTNFGANELWRNLGDGTFEEVGQEAGVDDGRWGVPAVVFDYDRDGWLDLYVGNYVAYSISTHQECTTQLGRPNYCGPLAFQPQGDVLFRNLGAGSFRNVTVEAGLGGALGGALGAIPADFNRDGWIDLYVGNDGMANHLWINQQNGTFRNQALLAGAAVNARGQPEASMGIAAADLDGDGDEDLFMTHLRQETNTLYINDGTGLFEDRSNHSGLGPPSVAATGFGTAFFDLQNDGRLDLLTVNGAVRIRDELADRERVEPLAEPNQLFLGTDGGFAEASDRAGPAFQLAEVSRGAAFGDLDNDGDTDVVLSNNGGPTRVLINRVGQDQGWLGLRLVDRLNGTDAVRDLVGAWVGVSVDGGTTLWRRSRTSGSYASAHDPRVLLGLGVSRSGVARVRVLWPDPSGPGAIESEWEEFDNIPISEYSTLVRGEGTP